MLTISPLPNPLPKGEGTVRCDLRLSSSPEEKNGTVQPLTFSLSLWERAGERVRAEP